MENRSQARIAFLLATGTASFATLSLELMLTRIYSVTMYYHFAFMVISLALLGTGIAGVTVYLLPGLASRRPGLAAAACMVLFSLAALFALEVALENPASLWDWDLNWKRLPRIYLAAVLPFLASGFAITIAISAAGERIGRVYAADLGGAALGCVFVIVVLPVLGGQGSIIMAAALGSLSAVFFAASETRTPRWRWAVAAVCTLCVVVLAFLSVTEPRARRMPPAHNPEKFIGANEPVFEKWNATSQITVSPLGATDHLWITIDGGAGTRIWQDGMNGTAPQVSRYYPEVQVASLVYELSNEGPALIIGPGGGTDVISALVHGVPEVIGVEINPIIVQDVMKGRYADYSGRLYHDERVHVVVDEGRSRVRRSPRRFSSIQATLVDTWAVSSSGALSLTENNLYTVEAFEEFLAHLQPGGLLAFTRWYLPGQPREMLRLTALAREALERRGVPPDRAREHILIVAGRDSRATLLVGPEPLAFGRVEKVAGMTRTHLFDIVWTPYPVTGAQASAVPEKNCIHEDPLIASFLRAPDARMFLAGLPWDSSPTTDDRPFFFSNIRLGEMIRMLGSLEQVEMNNLSLLILLVVLALSSALTLLFILLPLAAFRRKALAGNRWRKLGLLAYFLCLGLGFILVEIGFMQRFVLFLGHPIHALSVVLATLLVSSGTGSALSAAGIDRWGARGLVLRAIPALAVLLGLYAVGLGPLFRWLVGLPLPARIAIAAVLVGLPGLLMGTLLPTGIRTAISLGRDLVPWAWGLNGAASVVGSVLAVVVSLWFGFTTSLGVGIGLYLVALAFLQASARDPSPAGGAGG